MQRLLSPALRALAQTDDPVFVGVLLRSLALSALAFALVGLGSGWAAERLLALPGWWGWLARGAGVLGAAVAALWLFLPVAMVIASLYIERVAAAVDRRFYPDLPPAAGAPLPDQVWDGLALGARVLLFNLAGLLLALLLPGIGLLLGWGIAAWAVGRGLFMAVAMRRMERAAAQALYRRRRAEVLAQGALLALAGSVPLLNLLVPVLGAAAMVHVLERPRRAARLRGR